MDELIKPVTNGYKSGVNNYELISSNQEGFILSVGNYPLARNKFCQRMFANGY